MKLATLAKKSALAAALALGLAAAAEAQDVVRLKSGTEVKCKITAMTSSSITYSETGGKVSTAKAEDVANVTLGDPPSSLAKAEAAMGNSQYDKAISNYQVALEEIGKEKKRDFHKWHILFQMAHAMNQKNPLPDGPCDEPEELAQRGARDVPPPPQRGRRQLVSRPVVPAVDGNRPREGRRRL
jgi:hypothetical protein